MSEVISDDVTRDDVRGIVISPDILEPLKNTYVKHQITSKVITGKQKVRSGLHAGGGGGWGGGRAGGAQSMLCLTTRATHNIV